MRSVAEGVVVVGDFGLALPVGDEAKEGILFYGCPEILQLAIHFPERLEKYIGLCGYLADTEF
ncbi:hypothetical protein [Microbulbifer thermotolerans]|uniref:hypothetical protein n=1 Tax=Microbulbifer thermotolerans TaxID=252514 RepID=UPI00224B113B|nr:hypothetical protein [Microbulbifer thermotolerans]MCX2781312.1 hypothetical protein [Microbulbifer thermotolerans]MCX2806690.1 hypothetical protein [Microbulbifer thermotolerans]MCX2842552.1 hypothetical protein [Microbulbifer thermotolerans]